MQKKIKNQEGGQHFFTPLYIFVTLQIHSQVQISLDNNVERSFSILIHKSVENYMGQTSLFVERSGSSHFINQITSLIKYMLNDYKSTAQNRAAPKVAISIQFT